MLVQALVFFDLKYKVWIFKFATMHWLLIKKKKQKKLMREIRMSPVFALQNQSMALYYCSMSNADLDLILWNSSKF